MTNNSRHMHKPIKPFLTYEQQLDHLKNDKKLIIPDDQEAIHILSNVSYFALIGGYKTLFYNTTTRIYKTGTSFNDIVSLYQFDDSLRDLVFKYSRNIEEQIRCKVSYAFCDKYGNHQSEYLNPTHYQNTKKNRYSISKLLNILDYAANKSTEHTYVVYQRNKYGNVPLYIIMKTLTLGQTSAMYSLLERGIQIKLSTQYADMSVNDLINFLRVLTHFRNVCAHNERLFSHKDRYDIPDTALHKKMNIPLKGKQYMYGKHDFFAIVIAFRYLLGKTAFSQFKKSLIILINRAVKQASTLTENELLEAMGFPPNWKNITRYKL